MGPLERKIMESAGKPGSTVIEYYGGKCVTESKAPDWLIQASKLDLSSESMKRKAIHTVFVNVDDMLRAGKVFQVDRLLADLDTNSVSSNTLVSLLSITLASDDELPSRGDFWFRVRDTFEDRNEDLSMLRGLDKFR